MSVISISRGSYSRGKEVAERVAKELGYECISREIILEASEQFNIPETKLVRAIHDAPSGLNRFTHGKEKFVAYLRAALLKHIREDKIVYHGLAGQFFLQDIPHVLKVRVISDLEDRIQKEMERENINAEEARYILKKDDDERRKWGIYLYGKDPWDSGLYDLVTHIKTKTVDDVVSLILHALSFECFKTTPESQRVVDNLSLAAEVKAALVDKYPLAKVSAKDGKVLIKIEEHVIHEKDVTDEIKDIAGAINGIKEVNIHVIPII